MAPELDLDRAETLGEEHIKIAERIIGTMESNYGVLTKNETIKIKEWIIDDPELMRLIGGCMVTNRLVETE